MANSKHTIEELRQRQSLPLDAKIQLTYARVKDWIDAYGEQGVYISFSGGKDSTVLLDLVRNRFGYSDVKAVFVDVPTQYPELKQFVKMFDNVDIIKPKISFIQVCEKYGFPLISKEVSESVEGARKYLKSIISEAQAGGGGSKHPYKYFYDKVQGIGDFAHDQSENYKNSSGGGQAPYKYEYEKLTGTGHFATNQPSACRESGSGGGVPYKTTKLLGMGRFSPRTTGNHVKSQSQCFGGEQTSCCTNGLADEGRSDPGEYP